MPSVERLEVGLHRKGKYISNTFRRRADADTWALETERTIDKSPNPEAINPRSVQSFSDVIDLHIQDMQEVGKTIRRSKIAVLEALKAREARLGKLIKHRLEARGREIDKGPDLRRNEPGLRVDEVNGQGRRPDVVENRDQFALLEFLMDHVRESNRDSVTGLCCLDGSERVVDFECRIEHGAVWAMSAVKAPFAIGHQAGEGDNGVAFQV